MCGVLGIYTEGLKNKKALAYYGMQGIQHRGQEAAGLIYHASFCRENTFNNISNIFKVEGSVERLFRQVEIEQVSKPNNYVILGHTRYSTTKNTSEPSNNIQPYLINTIEGSLSLIHNGNLTNTPVLRNLLIKLGIETRGESDSEIILLLIGYYWNKSKKLEESIIKVVKLCEGAVSLIIGTQDTMYIYKDPNNIRPLVEGIYKEGDCLAYIVISETSGLDTMGAVFTKEIPIGTLSKYNKDSKGTIIYKSPKIKERVCIFESIYFSRPDSLINNEAIYNYRFRLGQRLGQLNNINADLVVGTPDSGITAALGFSYSSGISYGEAFVKNRYIGRTFIQPTQEMRSQGLKLKLNVIPHILKNKSIILIDDSIVRGNTCKLTIANLRAAGVKEVHMRITSPPVINPCNLGMDFPTQEELISYNRSIEEIRNYIGADSLMYLSVEDILEAATKDATSFCTGCFNGNYL